jgi:hypothetical protein
MEPDRQDALLREYGEASASFRLLTDIRFKLLGFLPLAAGVAAGAIASRRPSAGALALSLFGLGVTLALLLYNERNNQLYNELVGRAARIERELGLPDGAFANRPASWLRIGRLNVDHGTGVGAIYAATIGLWFYGALSSALGLLWEAGGDDRTQEAVPAWVGAVALPLAIVLPIAGWRWLHDRANARRASMREQASKAVQAALAVQPFDIRAAAVHPDVILECAKLAGHAKAFEKVTARANHYATLDDDELRLYVLGPPAPPDTDVRGRQRAAAYLVALLTDLPPSWIDDVASGRRG